MCHLIAHNKYMNKQVEEWFDRRDYTFHAITYQKGELLVSPALSLRRMIFVLEGEIAIYSINEDGNLYPISLDRGFTVLGDMEFAGDFENRFYVEAKSEVQGVYLEIDAEWEKLNTDIRFLQHIIKALRRKISLYEKSTTFSPSVEEQLNVYLHTHDRIQDIEVLSYRFHCSRRQLIRVLKKLEEEGTLVHVRRGLYMRNDTKRKKTGGKKNAGTQKIHA